MDLSLTLEDFSNANLQAEEIYPGIFVVRNFLKETEIAALELQFSKMSEDDWKKSYVDSLYEFIEYQYGVKTFEEAQALGHEIKIDEDWVDKNAIIEDFSISQYINIRLNDIFSRFPDLQLQGVGSIQRQYEGTSLSYHIDSLSNPDVVFANVMYINDNFSGGELHFPEIDVMYKPERGALIVFPSADEYLHGTMPVGPGEIRYVLPAFVNKLRDTDGN